MNSSNENIAVFENVKDLCSDSQIKILKDSNLMIKIIDEVHKYFSGEEDTIMAIVVSICTRLVNDCNPESRNLVLSEMTGAGKDRLVKTIANILLESEETYFQRSKLTPEAFTYWHALDKDWNWNGKLVHIEDPTTELMNCQTMKTIASGEKKGTVIDKQKAIDINIKGKPNLIITTFEGYAELELVRRYPFIHLDTSKELTKQVMSNIALKYKGELVVEPDSDLHNALSKGLVNQTVIIPFADELVDYFPDHLIMRTHFRRFLDYVSASACLFQYQREKDNAGRLIATWDDYELARITYLKTVSTDAQISLNPDQEALLRLIKKANKPVFVSEIHDELPKGKDWIYDNCELLKRHKLIKQGREFKEDANRDVITFQVDGCLGSSDLAIRKVVWLSGLSAELKKIDERRSDAGFNRLFNIYYNNTNNTSQPLCRPESTTNRKPTTTKC